MIPNTNNCSVLRYVGGKTRACKILDKILCEHFDTSKYNKLISPFFGGGSFEFYLQNKYNYKLFVNDKFTPLYNFWKQIKINKNLLCDELYKIIDNNNNNNINININVDKKDFNNYRKTIMNLNNDTLQQSILYFIINRCSFNGSTLSGGFSEEASKKRFTKSSIDKITKLDLSNVELYNLDFEIFLNSVEYDDNTLLFLDPPYYLCKKSNLYGNNGDMHENFDHQKLFDTIKNKQHWIITYNNCEYIKKLYEEFTIIDVSWKYSMNNNNKPSSEIVIISKKNNG